ncbi:hypothetical protein MSAN_00883900 [Mycena sanguinolenta]|uniref:Uncharacterized protein n=1 Tax=Mycena sanguinolenta TaxID=230812 RepID=A0A8H6YWM3_9AGAR|nr:hypothetical protein MSAN_00883900 [Mycena sanguinolenta]
MYRFLSCQAMFKRTLIRRRAPSFSLCFPDLPPRGSLIHLYFFKTTIIPFDTMFRRFNFVLTLIFFVFPFIIAAQNSSECAAPVRNDCTFYTDCLEARYDCGPDGYPLAFGFHFCNKFADSKSELSSAGQVWMSNTMLCLQRALVPEATGAPGAAATCADLKTKAFATHADCYVQSGLCSLPITDWEKIAFEIVGPGTLVDSFDALKATASVGVQCTEFFAKVVASNILRVRGAGPSIFQAL